MSFCSDPFCSCCKRAYSAGYQNGFKDGYVTGYVDRHLRIDPPESYKPLISERINKLSTYINKLDCGCYMVCTCPKIKPFKLETKPLFNNDYLNTDSFMSKRLSCGCYGACNCYKPIEIKPVKLYDSYNSNTILSSDKSCNCIDYCTCLKTYY